MITIDISRQSRATVIHVSGALDRASIAQFSAAIDGKIVSDGAEVIIDLSKLERVDESGLRQLYSSLKRARRGGGDLSLAQPQERVWNALESSRLHELFEIYDSLADALTHS
jgi:anti-anti-sigma factor